MNSEYRGIKHISHRHLTEVESGDSTRGLQLTCNYKHESTRESQYSVKRAQYQYLRVKLIRTAEEEEHKYTYNKTEERVLCIDDYAVGFL